MKQTHAKVIREHIGRQVIKAPSSIFIIYVMIPILITTRDSDL